LELLKNRAYVALISADFCLLLAYAGTMAFIPTFLVTAKGVDILLANLLYMFAPSIGIVGMLTSGTIASRVGDRRTVLCFISSVLAGILLFTFRVDLISLTIGLILFGYGIFSTFPLMTDLVIGTTSAEVRGVSLGVFNFSGMVGSAIGPIAVGYFADISSFNNGFVFAALVWVGYLILISMKLYKFSQGGSPR
jgi:sugar phosphate permease